jgi:hypothetical protein
MKALGHVKGLCGQCHIYPNGVCRALGSAPQLLEGAFNVETHAVVH